MGPTWVLSAPDGPHVGPMNLAISVCNGFVVIMILKMTITVMIIICDMSKKYMCLMHKRHVHYTTADRIWNSRWCGCKQNTYYFAKTHQMGEKYQGCQSIHDWMYKMCLMLSLDSVQLYTATSLLTFAESAYRLKNDAVVKYILTPTPQFLVF